MQPKRYVILNEADNVAVAIDNLSRGEHLEIPERFTTVVLTSEVSFSHKFALVPIPDGAAVYKYGCPIGVAYRPIAAGEHVHLQNLKTQMAEQSAPSEGWTNRGEGGVR